MKKAILVLNLIISILILSSCTIYIPKYEHSALQFEELCVTVAGGYRYFLREGKACLIALPEEEEVYIPHEIDGYQVQSIGGIRVGAKPFLANYDYEPLYSESVRTMIIDSEICFERYYMPNLEKIIYYGNITNVNFKKDLKVDIDYSTRFFHLQNPEKCASHNFKSIELRYQFVNDIELFSNLEIYMSKYVTTIDKDFFSNVKNSKFYTYFEEKPDGWEDGWNGDNEVLWGITSNEQIIE